MFGSAMAKHYPNRPEEALLRLRLQTGSFGNSVRMGQFLNLEVCQSGLRVEPARPLGTFGKTFFVPWAEITVERTRGLYLNRAALQFGDPEIGRLNIPAHVANRIARAASGNWSEPGPFQDETPGQAFLAVARAWILGTVVISVMFVVLFRLAPLQGSPPPLIAWILVPSIILGAVSILSYYRRIRR